MKRSVAAYNDRVRTLFCANCAERCLELSVRDAAQLERDRVPIYCSECAPIVAEALQLEQSQRVMKQSIEDVLRIQREQMDETINTLDVARLMLESRLREIKERRWHEHRWAAGNN